MIEKRQPLIQIAIFVLALMSANSLRAETQVIDKTFEVSANGQLVLNSDQGKIHVKTWDKSSVAVSVKKTARSEDRLKEFKVSFKQKGDDVYVDGDGGWNSRVRVSYEVQIPENYNLDIETGGGSITVEDINGNVKANTSGGSIKVGTVTNGNANLNTSGGSIKVGDVGGNLTANTSGGSIRLGRVTGVTDMDTSGGSITLDEGGGNVNAETSGGSIKIGPVNGKVNADTSGGSIRIGLAQDDVKASTSGGTIRVEGSKGRVDVDTSGGNIFIGGSGGPIIADTAGGSIRIKQARGSIKAETGGGKIEAEMVLADADADTQVNLETSGGSITLYLPRTLAATISADLRITRSARKDYRIYSDFPIVISSEQNGRVTAKGDINGGGDPIVLSTSNGDIHIKMLDD